MEGFLLSCGLPWKALAAKKVIFYWRLSLEKYLDSIVYLLNLLYAIPIINILGLKVNFYIFE